MCSCVPKCPDSRECRVESRNLLAQRQEADKARKRQNDMHERWNIWLRERNARKAFNSVPNVFCDEPSLPKTGVSQDNNTQYYQPVTIRPFLSNAPQASTSGHETGPPHQPVETPPSQMNGTGNSNGYDTSVFGNSLVNISLTAYAIQSQTSLPNINQPETSQRERRSSSADSFVTNPWGSRGSRTPSPEPRSENTFGTNPSNSHNGSTLASQASIMRVNDNSPTPESSISNKVSDSIIRNGGRHDYGKRGRTI